MCTNELPGSHLNARLFRSCEHISTSIQSLEMAIDLHINEKIKSCIHSNAFVNFGALVFDERWNEHNLHGIMNDNAALESKRKTIPKIQTNRQSCSYNSHTRITAVLQMDCAENYSWIAQDEIQSAHWNQAQVTLVTSVAWFRGNTSPHMVISDSLRHERTTTVGFLDEHMTEMPKEATEIRVWTDGPASQFRNEYVMSAIQPLSEKHGKTIIWNFSAGLQQMV